MPRNRRGDRDDDKGRRGGRGRERDGTVCGAERQHDDCDLQLFDQDALEDECERGTARPARLLDLRDLLRVLVAFRLAARRPQDRLLQPLDPRVNPTASTIVAASTSSTAHARNADAKAKTPAAN